jgi:GR25 family glycosyltransferase involved in LPS biosynthesis
MAKITRVSREYKSRSVNLQQKMFPKRDPNFQPMVSQKAPPAPITTANNTPPQTPPVVETPSVEIPPAVPPGTSVLNSYFDAIYCINLDRRADKWQESVQEFAKHNLNVTRVSAVDGSTLKTNGNINPGEMGCAKSHVNILKHMVQSGMKKILVLEDDITFIDNIQDFWLKNLSNIPSNWGMLYLGGNHLKTPIKVNSVMGRCGETYTTSCYAITGTHAKACIPLIERMNVQVDVAFASTHRSGNCYAFMPSIGWQRPGYSDIQEGFRDYTGFIK